MAILLPRSEYPRLHGYDKRAGDVVDALGYVGWSIGRDLRRDREAAGLTQAQVARRAGIRPETLSRLEKRAGESDRWDSPDDCPGHRAGGAAGSGTLGAAFRSTA